MLKTETRAVQGVNRIALSPTEAATALGVSRQHIYDLMARGVLPSVKLGGKTRRIPVAALENIVSGGNDAPAA